MREQTLINAMAMHDRAINSLRTEFQAMQKVLDKTYVQSLTHVMMWDVLMSLLDQNKLVTKAQFDTALQELSERTRKAMEAAQPAQAGPEMPPEGKTTVLSQEPQIPFVAVRVQDRDIKEAADAGSRFP